MHHIYLIYTIKHNIGIIKQNIKNEIPQNTQQHAYMSKKPKLDFMTTYKAIQLKVFHAKTRFEQEHFIN